MKVLTFSFRLFNYEQDWGTSPVFINPFVFLLCKPALCFCSYYCWVAYCTVSTPFCIIYFVSNFLPTCHLSFNFIGFFWACKNCFFFFKHGPLFSSRRLGSVSLDLWAPTMTSILCAICTPLLLGAGSLFSCSTVKELGAWARQRFLAGKGWLGSASRTPTDRASWGGESAAGPHPLMSRVVREGGSGKALGRGCWGWGFVQVSVRPRLTRWTFLFATKCSGVMARSLV